MEQQIQQALQLLQEKGYRLSGRDLEVIPMLLLGRQYTGGNRGTVSVLNNNVNGGVPNEPTGAERVSGVFENTMPVGPGTGSGHGQPGELAGGNQVLYRVLNNDRATSDALMRVGSAYTDLHDTTAQPQVFTAALDDAIKANKHGLMVSSKTPQELADSGAVTFMTNDGLAGGGCDCRRRYRGCF